MLIFTVVFLLFAKTMLNISTKEGSALLLLYGVFLIFQIVYVL